MTGRPGQRRRLWVLLALAGLVLVSPLESGLLPGRLGDMLETPQAEAQNPPYQLGMPDPCPKLAFFGLPAFAEDRSLMMDDGTDPDYPTLWRASGDGSECVLELPACPISPIRPIGRRLMWPSVASPKTEMDFGHLDPRVGANNLWTDTYLNLNLDRYPEFCEDRVDSTDLVVFEHCRDNVIDHVVTLHASATVCRVLIPLACPDASTVGVGMNRDGAQSCRTVQRRTWTCATGYLPANTFNACYQRAPVSDPAQHLACQTGSPDFPLGPSAQFLRDHPTNTPTTPSQLACAEYVGEDFTDQRSCPDGTPNSFQINFGIVGNNYWCSYQVWQLRTECYHPNGPADCLNAGEALCIKRISRTGGCDQVAQTILCRAFESAFEQGLATLEQVRVFGGCDPCVALPFESAGDIPSRCPTPSLDSEPRDTMKRILRVRGDLDYLSPQCSGVEDRDDFLARPACMARPACADPPQGRIEWESSHFSGRVLVNSPVVVRIVDILVERVPERFASFGNLTRPFLFNNLTTLNLLHYEDTIGENVPAPRLVNFQISPTDATGKYASVADMVSTDHGRRANECLARDDPVFHVIVQELWPDQQSDQTEIKDLFGEDALDGWDNLNFGERRAITEARGITWRRPLSDAESMALCIPVSATPPCTTWDEPLPDQQSIDDRADALLTNELECRQDSYRTCIWNPPRPGFFKLTGGGAWRVSKSSPRRWGGSSFYTNDTSRAAQFLATNSQAVQRLVSRSPLTPEDQGLRVQGGTVKLSDEGWDPTCFLVSSSPYCSNDRDWLFTEDATPTTVCSSIDFRVVCGSGEAGNYTETEPVGVLVHEVQVRTVMPSR